MKKPPIIKIVVLTTLLLALATAGRSQEQAQDFCGQGQKLLAAGQYLQAAKAYQQAIRLQPGLETAHLGLKKAYQGLTFGEQIEEAQRLCHSLGPHDAVGHYGLGLLYREKGDYGYAQDEYLLLQKLDPALAQRLNGANQQRR